ncbi:Anthocyanidin 3-O-glucoside 6''-O-acyltransferase (Fragment) [Linum perenne]
MKAFLTDKGDEFTKLTKLKPSQPATAFVVTSSFLWSSLIKSAISADGDKFDCYAFPVDCRGRVDPKLSGNYFGNCLSGIRVLVKRKDLIGEDGIVIATREIGWRIKEIEIEGAVRSVEKYHAFSGRSEIMKVVTVAGLSKLRIYETNFRWGRPRKSEPIHVDFSGNELDLQAATSRSSLLRRGYSSESVPHRKVAILSAAGGIGSYASTIESHDESQYPLPVKMKWRSALKEVVDKAGLTSCEMRNMYLYSHVVQPKDFRQCSSPKKIREVIYLVACNDFKGRGDEGCVLHHFTNDKVKDYTNATVAKYCEVNKIFIDEIDDVEEDVVEEDVVGEGVVGEDAADAIIRKRGKKVAADAVVRKGKVLHHVNRLFLLLKKSLGKKGSSSKTMVSKQVTSPIPITSFGSDSKINTSLPKQRAPIADVPVKILKSATVTEVPVLRSETTVKDYQHEGLNYVVSYCINSSIDP